MMRMMLMGALAAVAVLAWSGHADAPQAARAGCIQYEPVPGSGNWKFFNHCGGRVEVAYCVRYQRGNPPTYVGRFRFNNSLTVRLVNIPNQIQFNYCRLDTCRPQTPPC
jgi:hypothetical protein